MLSKKKLNDWENNRDGRLGLVILGYFIQRMANDGIAKFKYDKLTCKVARQVFDDHKLWMSYKFAERLFLIMPLIHSEDLADTDLALLVLHEEVEMAEMNNHRQLHKRLLDLTKQAEIISSVIQRFGRLPYRNALMNRENTEEENEFLTQEEDDEEGSPE